MTNDIITNLNDLNQGDRVCLLYAYEYRNGTIGAHVMYQNCFAVEFIGDDSPNLATIVFINPAVNSAYNDAHLTIAGGWSTRGFFPRPVADGEDYNVSVLGCAPIEHAEPDSVDRAELALGVE